MGDFKRREEEGEGGFKEIHTLFDRLSPIIYLRCYNILTAVDGGKRPVHNKCQHVTSALHDEALMAPLQLLLSLSLRVGSRHDR